MARILGVEIPGHKRVVIGLTRIYGIGNKTSNVILEAVKVDPDKKIIELSQEEVSTIVKEIRDHYLIEGALRSKVQLAIKLKKDIGCYVGKRLREGRTVRGQRTKNNCRTKKGPKKNAIKKRSRSTSK